jgi:hypothetical protein
MLLTSFGLGELAPFSTSFIYGDPTSEFKMGYTWWNAGIIQGLSISARETSLCTFA